MKFRIQVLRVADDGVERMKEVIEFERQELAMETLGMSLAEGKAVLKGVQEFVAEQQGAEFLQRERTCRHDARHLSSKGAGFDFSAHVVRDSAAVSRPGKGPFDRSKAGCVGKPLLSCCILEVRWASLISYGGVARLLEDVLPVAYTQNGMTIRNHVLETAERIETDLGEEKPMFFDGSEQDWEAQPLPDGPMTVGIDGGFVRAAHKEGFFEVIAGKSVVDFRRSDEEATPSSKCFSFVQTFDQKPRRRLWELLKSQGMQENQQVVLRWR
jgi:hypothetical protein